MVADQLGKTGIFGPATKSSVKLFQARNVDAEGNSLKQDGKLGPITWGALFGVETVPATTEPTSPFLGAVLSKAASQVGILEEPRNSNSGPEVDDYLQRAGVSLDLPSNGEAMSVVRLSYWCFDETAIAQGRPNPMMRTAGCLGHWNGECCVMVRAASLQPRRPTIPLSSAPE